MPELNLEEFKTLITSRRKISNSFTFYREILQWIEDGDADGYIVDGNAFLFHRTNGFYKFCFFVDQFSDIRLAVDLLKSYKETGRVSLAYTTKNNAFVNDLAEAITALNFSFYAEYARFINVLPEIDETNEEVTGKRLYEFAESADLDQLHDIMYREFDVISDDLPSKDTLKKLIDENAILIKKIEGKIALIQIYELTRGSLYSRMTWIDKKYRKPRYTVDFYQGINDYVRDLRIKDLKKMRSYGWINKANKNYAINLKFGAQLDGVSCHIYIYS